MLQTSLHKKKFNPNGANVGGNSHKYRFIIKPLLESSSSSSSSSSSWTKGKGLKFIVTNKKRKYKFWDDPNELCERLQILVGEKAAGNNIHDDEISSIISELEQKKYIIKAK